MLLLMQLVNLFSYRTDPHVYVCRSDEINNPVCFAENMKWAIEFIRIVMKFIDENEDFPWTTQEFLNYQRREDGCTALHLAILSGSIETVDCLIDLGADIFIRFK